MSDHRQPIVKPPKNKGGNLWAVLVGVALVVVIVGLFAWRLWPEAGMATSPTMGEAPVVAPADATTGTDAPATTDAPAATVQ